MMKKLILGFSACLILSAVFFVFTLNSHERDITVLKISYERQLEQKDIELKFKLKPYIESFANEKTQTKLEREQAVKYLSRLSKADVIEVEKTVFENIPLKTICDEVLRYKEIHQID